MKPAPLRLLIILLLALALGACASYHPVSMSQPTPNVMQQVHAGDDVKLVTRDGQTLRFEVTAVSDDGVLGEPGLIPWEDVQSLEVRDQRASGVFTGLTTEIFVALLVTFVAMAAAF